MLEIMSIISKMDENRSLGELGTGIKMFKERPPVKPRPVLASSGCHDPGQPPPPTRGQLCMTEPSPALTSILPVPPSLIFVMRLLHYFLWDSFVMKRLTVTTSDCSSGFYNLQPRSSQSVDIWKLLINICNKSLQYLLYKRSKAAYLDFLTTLPCTALHCHIKTTPCPCIIPMAYCHGLFLSFSEIYLINEYNQF